MKEKSKMQNGWKYKVRLLFLAGIVLIFLSGSIVAGKNAAKAGEPLLRVKLGSLSKRVEINFAGEGKILNEKGRTIRTLRARQSFVWQLPAANKRKRIEHNNETLTFQSRDNRLTINGKSYRGILKVKFSSAGALVVNHVGIEDYLRGVVGSEMGSLSPAESLKAQTVIARTYAYSNRGKHGRDGADVCDSTHCQVYKGISSERESINTAVDGTRGIIMISDGKPIQTLYHASCGGMTSDNDKVFGGAACSYLRRVICPFCKAGLNYRWSRTLSLQELRTQLAKENIHFNYLFDIGYEAPALMDRVDKVIFNTDKGEFAVKGTTFRRLFDLKSTTFTLGNRRNVKAIIAAAATVKTEPAEKVRLVVANLTETASDGPPQLIIQTGRGLKRAKRPDEGWKTISCHLPAGQPVDNAVSQIHGSRNEPLRSAATGKIEQIEIFGRGYGHQVGLCQSGAIELGKRNWSYRQILPFYYSNVALRKLGY